MRERPEIWKKQDRVNFLCVLATMLGKSDLRSIPMVLSNWRSVLSHPAVGHSLGVANLRTIGIDIATRQGIRHLVHEYNDYHDRRHAGRLIPSEDLGIERRFDINPHPSNLSFRPLWGEIKPNDVMEAEVALTSVLADHSHGRTQADPAHPFDVRDDAAGFAAAVNALPFTPAPAPRHDLAAAPRGPISITWSELLEEARRLDALDAASCRQIKGNWETRLRDTENGSDKVELLSPDAARAGLAASAGMHLSGLKHLIGLPGAGKTTILYLLASWLARNGYRALFLLPSIEISANFIETLWDYDIRAGLLSGQAPTTRIRHMNRLAEGLATKVSRGFGITRPVAGLMGANCALAAFSNPSVGFPHMSPPCASLRQMPHGKRKERIATCPLAGVCGRNAAQRGLVDASIWVGHVMSMDSRIWYPYANEEVHYFEFVARTFDLVVVDEVDEAQAMLDQQGAIILGLTGQEGSFDDRLHRKLLGRIAGADNRMIADRAVFDFASDSGTFGDFNRRLVTIIRELDRPVRESFKDQMVTTNRIFSALCPDPVGSDEAESEEIMERRWALEAVWTENAKRALYSPMDDRFNDPDLEDIPFDAARVARILGVDVDAIHTASRDLLSDMRNWVASTWNSDIKAVGHEIRERFAAFMRVSADGESGEHLKLLLGATFVILQYFKLAHMLRNMISRGILDDTDIGTSLSPDLSRLLPESILGRLSGVRYQYDEEGGIPGIIRLQHVSFSSAPRMLLYRLHELFAHEERPGPAVLLASATSFLEQSPGYHVPVGPDYVLRRVNSGNGWSDSRYSVSPIPDPDQPTRSLRFSGAPLASRNAILCRMVDALLRNGDTSPIAKAIRHNDVQHGIQRRVALVVNSYEQVEVIKAHIDRRHRSFADRVRAVVARVPTGHTSYQYLTASQADGLSYDEDWEIVILPMAALGRGVNIVFPDGPRRNQAMIGTVYFLTRPHPSSESLAFIQAITGAESLSFDRAILDPGWNLADIDRQYAAVRHRVLENIRRLLRHKIQMARLGPLRTPFVADNMIQVLQTIGRAMRGDRPAFVHFVDAAWAPGSAAGNKDTAATSMLVAMIEILNLCVGSADPVDRAVYEELYRPFLDPMSRISGLNM